MSMQLRVTEIEIIDVLDWSKEHIEEDTTDHECGTYEEGVHDAIRWMIGLTHSRPDGV